MGSDASVLGSLHSVDGEGFVRMEDRLGTGIDDLWGALSDPGRLARWYGEVEGTRRPLTHPVAAERGRSVASRPSRMRHRAVVRFAMYVELSPAVGSSATRSECCSR
jgi:hypothetical protein